MEIVQSSAADLLEIKALLSANKLPVKDIADGKQIIFVSKSNEELIGCVALEIYGTNALFRSLAVKENYRNNSIGKDLYTSLLQFALEKGLNNLYLLTTTAEGYFKNKGWTITNRNLVPDEIRNSSEFSSLCPSTAICMEISLLPKHAEQIFTKGFNCAQAVFHPFALQSGISSKQALSLTTGFGAGMVYRGEMCGAITGAMMAIGLKYGRSDTDDNDAKDKTYLLIHELHKRFSQKHGAIHCAKLLNMEKDQPDYTDWEKVKLDKKFETQCPVFVYDAARITQELVNTNF